MKKWKKHIIKKNLSIYRNISFSIIGKSQIIIWPESAISDFEYNQKKFLKKLENQFHIFRTKLITGIVYLNLKNYKYYNSVLTIGNKYSYNHYNKCKYKKNHLVPFGEFIPIKKIFLFLIPFLNFPIDSFKKGPYLQKQIQINNYKFTTVICYEILLSKQIRNNSEKNTDFILNISNDTWFKNSIEPWQHFQISKIRAKEIGKPLLRISNSGITAFIYQNGETKKIIPQFKRNFLKFKNFSSKGFTPYFYCGDFLKWFLIFLYYFLSLYIIKY